ncbi:MAG: hypothetical protein II699_07080 [Lachnospiraceae bacterium]|nr:hypothetical protein [Lachnospiraceae bacterium]
MLAKRLTYKSYDGEEFTETLYFSLNKAEAMTLQVSKEGGFKNYLDKLKDSHNGREIMQTTQDIIISSYAEKTPDGKSLMKSPEIANRFRCSAAYDALFTELVLDGQKMAEFINGILPDDFEEFADKLAKNVEKIETDGGKVVSIEAAK